MDDEVKSLEMKLEDLTEALDKILETERELEIALENVARTRRNIEKERAATITAIERLRNRRTDDRGENSD